MCNTTMPPDVPRRGSRHAQLRLVRGHVWAARATGAAGNPIYDKPHMSRDSSRQLARERRCESAVYYTKEPKDGPVNGCRNGRKRQHVKSRATNPPDEEDDDVERAETPKVVNECLFSRAVTQLSPVCFPLSALREGAAAARAFTPCRRRHRQTSASVLARVRSATPGPMSRQNHNKDDTGVEQDTRDSHTDTCCEAWS